MNNEVRNGWGRLVGFRCFECGGIFEKMWGEVCNGCRETERRHREMIAAMKASQAKVPDETLG